jgi:hypothetical protein
VPHSAEWKSKPKHNIAEHKRRKKGKMAKLKELKDMENQRRCLNSSYDNNCKYWKSEKWAINSMMFGSVPSTQYIISCSINGVLLPLTTETEALQKGLFCSDDIDVNEEEFHTRLISRH